MSDVHRQDLSVCILVADLDAETGGIQKNTRLLLSSYKKLGVKTSVCARNYNEQAREEFRDGVYIRRSPVLGRNRVINSIAYLIDCWWWLVRHRSEYQVVHCQQVFGPTMAASIASLFTGKPIVTRVTLTGFIGEAQTLERMSFSRLRKRLLRRVARWIVLSREMRDEIISLGIDPARIEIVHNSTQIPEDSAAELSIREKYRADLGLRFPKLAVYVGRLSEEKRLDVLLDAWAAVTAEFPDAHLVLLGQGGDYQNKEEELRAQTESLDLSERVHFLGHVSNVKDHVMAADLFVLPTSAEGLSNALVEAFACGATIVASDIPANREICEDGVNSRLFPVGDAPALAELVSLLFSSPEESSRLARAARRMAVDELTVERMVNAYLDVYREAVAEARR